MAERTPICARSISCARGLRVCNASLGSDVMLALEGCGLLKLSCKNTGLEGASEALSARRSRKELMLPPLRQKPRSRGILLVGQTTLGR